MILRFICRLPLELIMSSNWSKIDAGSAGRLFLFNLSQQFLVGCFRSLKVEFSDQTKLDLKGKMVIDFNEKLGKLYEQAIYYFMKVHSKFLSFHQIGGQTISQLIFWAQQHGNLSTKNLVFDVAGTWTHDLLRIRCAIYQLRQSSTYFFAFF